MKLCSLSSGSSGNCIFIASHTTRILLDAGISARRICEELDSINESVYELDAVLYTHEHGDHIKSMGVLSRKYRLPLFGTKGTIQSAVCGKCNIGDIDCSLINYIIPDKSFMIGDIKVTPFAVSHDAQDPVAYIFEADGQKISTATDLGFYDERIFSTLIDCDLLYIESNHDVNMLEVGSYPYSLKQRIRGPYGHLSNDDCAELIVKLCTGSDKKIQNAYLAHLSEENNFPELALATVNAALLLNVPEDKRPALHVAPRNVHSFVAVI